MQNINFSSHIVSSLDHPLVADDTYVVVEPDPCKVLGFTVSPFFSVLALTVTIASADGSTIYREFKMSGATATQIVEYTPFLADQGLAWKATGAGAFSTLIASTFFIMQPGS